MSDVGLREARQDHPRKVAAGYHGLAGVAAELVFSGIERRITDERWESGDAHADFAQARVGIGDERDAGETANELCVNGERAGGVSGTHRRARTDCEEMENEIKNFGDLLCVTKLKRGRSQ